MPYLFLKRSYLLGETQVFASRVHQVGISSVQALTKRLDLRKWMHGYKWMTRSVLEGTLEDKRDWTPLRLIITLIKIRIHPLHWVSTVRRAGGTCDLCWECLCYEIFFSERTSFLLNFFCWHYKAPWRIYWTNVEVEGYVWWSSTQL